MTEAPDDFNPPVGEPVELEAGLRRILAPNPSPMTYRGTNTYLVGTSGLAVIDPGPASEPHLDAILAAVGPDKHVSHIIVTHSHLDHSPLAAELAKRTGAEIFAFGGPHDGRSRVMAQLAADGLAGGGEGIDLDFRHDHRLADGDVVTGDGWQLDVIHTPGHLGNHIALGWNDACFTADHVMGWATSLVSPPDGDLTDFMASCARLGQHSWRVFYPGHGAPITSPAERLDWLVNHRLSREKAILEQLNAGPADAATIARNVYTETPAALLPAAERNVFAHLVDLKQKSVVKAEPALSAKAIFHRL